PHRGEVSACPLRLVPGRRRRSRRRLGGSTVARRHEGTARSAVTIRLGDDDTVVHVDGKRYVIPVGAETLSRSELVSDPPRPEELTNAIGIVVDHLDDVVRTLPGVTEADVVSLVGDMATAIA